MAHFRGILIVRQKDKIVGLIAAVSNSFYIGWLFLNAQGLLGWCLVAAECMLALLTYLVVINHWTQKHVYASPNRSSAWLDVLLPVVNEPLELFEQTLRAAANINYAHKRVFVLDDGHRASVKRLSRKYGARYLSRSKRAGNKAGNLNFGLAHSQGEFVLTMDADQVCSPRIAGDLMGHFQDDAKLAIVSTRQAFAVPPNDFNHDLMFYQHMLAGKNADNAAISCGSGVFYRRSALDTVGGFQTWNIVEDLYTSYVLHQHGFASLYVNRAYSIGTAPIDLRMIYKQRGTWATDTLRLLFKRFHKGRLGFRQRLHYFELAWTYVVPAVALPIIFTLPALTLIFNVHIFRDESAYFIFRLPSLLATIYFYYLLCERSFSTSCFWAALSPAYLWGLILAVLPGKKRYQVTDKTARVHRDIRLILPHLTLIAFNLAALVYNIVVINRDRVTGFDEVSLIWMTLIVCWFAPLIRKGLWAPRQLPQPRLEEIQTAGSAA